ncbi:ribonuclease R [Dethiobacter alkaliphilus]|uniref:Ribonuclease R n=1 Tax=Dethiobacter alkaliphilus AHT 1 TaxID=555088 RepID=C0GFC0_DETAL|nr:ribonuclease R [Dethiobacter alkaliphilus]EEG77880.1 ribonuclease R [Dethiobacter alkaliphilus AHT 1]
MSFEEKVLNYMREGAYKPLKIEELTQQLGVEDKRDIKRFHKLLEEMEQEGKIIKTRYARYGVPEKMNLMVGTLQGNQAGFGFIIPNNRDFSDVFVPANQMNGAMHGDHVVARLIKGGSGRNTEGEIIRILKRRSNLIVGRYESGRQYGFVIPDDQRISQDIFIPKSEAKQLKNGMKVQVEITRWPEKRRNPEGIVVDVLGYPGDKGVDTLSIIKKYELPEDFPSQVMKEIKAFRRDLAPEDLEGRMDLRDLPMVTIDGADAKDLDDAVSLHQKDNGNWELGVHIADVGHYVKEGTALDKEAFHRGTSIYLVDRVIPMLPPELSNDLCSLNPQVDRLAMSVFMELNHQGKVVSHDFGPSVIRTQERMTYDDVRDILVDKDENLRKRYQPLVPMFEKMEEMAMILRKNRFDRGALDFAVPEVKVKLDEQGKPIDIVPRPRSIAEMIIEEFMLICNETVAEHFSRMEVPFVYRVHEQPSEAKMQNFREFVHNLGLSLKGSPDKIHSRALQALLDEVEGKPEERVVNTLLLRTMQQARYSAHRSPHYGLAAEYYSHFTSPIRRYPDLMIHRLMREYLQGMPPQKRLGKITKNNEAGADRASMRERLAMEAERESVDMKKVEFMEGKEGQEFDAVISGVTSFGLFAELENLVEGLVHVSSMDDDYYHFHEDKLALVGERTGKTYRIGKPVRVILKRASKEDRQIDFVLTEIEND